MAHYDLYLTDAEVKTLAWLTDRGYFPEELYDGMNLADDAEGDGESHYEIPEHAAWSLLALREEDPDAFLACLGGDLLEKIIELEQSIV